MSKILLIEDDSLIAHMYEKVMRFEGMEVFLADNGKDGLLKVKEVGPDLILCDIMMPKMNGIEVLEKIKANPETANIPVVMFSNLSGAHDAEIAVSKGALGYIVKSKFGPKEVVLKVKEFLVQTAQKQGTDVHSESVGTP